MNLANPQDSVLVALDVPTRERALELVGLLENHVGGFKVGLELFCSCGPSIIEEIGPSRTFLDLKYHDIPNTVASVSRVAARMGAMIFNVHCLGGFEMMRAAAQAAKEVNPHCKIIGVTILTSHDSESLKRIGLSETPREAVPRLALMAQEAGLDGVVCSAKEILPVRSVCGDDFMLVTPGIRPASGELGDQKRVLTPSEAIKAGADYLVVGRPITGASNPVAAANSLFS
jgi:orotidine-5'-phosphate decarboxylase